jgi:hypothetical protein
MAARSTHELTADTQISTKAGAVCALTVVTNGSADARVILYDAAAVGDILVTNKIAEITVVALSHYGGRTWVEPVRFTEGLYADVDGAGASFFVETRA